ncbi:MAG: rod shape-determining protein MreD [Myxococcales bacterium]|nr:rod shape-determining protein MreD [Myxococcales bacterium]
MRPAAIVIVALVLVLLQSTVLELAPVHIVTPACGLLVVLHAAFSERWSLSSTAMLSFGLGYLFDLVSGAPLGVHAFVYLVMSQLGRVLSTRVVMRGVVLAAGIAFLASLLTGALVIVVRAQINPEGGYEGISETPLEALLTGLFAPPVLWMLRQLEGRLDPARLRVGLARRRRRSLSHAATPR